MVNKNADDPINRLLEDFDVVSPELGHILRELRLSVLAIATDCEEKIMYGGIVFSIPNRMFCGLFLRKQHVSVEFDLGCFLEDEDGILEGKGKYRRHVKILTKAEIKTKTVEKFIEKSYHLQV